MDIQELKRVVGQAGIVGAGGAGFPLEFKLRDDLVDTLVINAAECEPLVYTDYTILHTNMDKVLQGARQVMDATHIQQCFLAMKQHTAEHLGLHQGQELAEGIHVHELPNVYPVGDEIILIYEVLKRVVQPGCLPFTEGVIVSNVETLYNVQKAIEGEPVTKKWLTINGNVPRRMVLQAPTGIKIAELFAQLGVQVPEGHVVIDGGPAMGKIINPVVNVVTKTTKSLLILPEDIPAVLAKTHTQENVLKRASSVCCQCSMCTDLCPRALIGYPISPSRTVRSVAANRTDHLEDYLSAALCCACGVCELMSCCQGISPVSVMQDIKRAMGAQKIRYVHEGPRVEAHPDREYRMLPSERFKSRIGVLDFDKETPEYLASAQIQPGGVTVFCSQHVGKPAQPVVQPGDVVHPGDLVAQADGMSANIHASVEGTVTAVDQKKIEIICR